MWEYFWKQLYAAEKKTFSAYEGAIEVLKNTPEPKIKECMEKRIQAIQTALAQLQRITSEEI